jgi:hypothetical protein
MKYKKLAKSLKGFNISWKNSGIFPKYKNISGPLVSKKRINRAKKIVKLILEEEKVKIINAFKMLVKKKYDSKKTVNVDIESAIECVNNTVLSKESDDIYGESDGEKIWISEVKMSDEYLVGTILHESLHHICTLDGKDICEKDEHYVMNYLGDDC